MAERGTPELRGLIQSSGGLSWQREVALGAAAVQYMLAPRLDELPFPVADGLVEWTRLWRDFPGAWAAMLRRFSAAVLAAPVRYLDWAAAHRCPLATGDAEDEEDELMRGQCGRWFASAALRMHQSRVHGRRCEVRQFVRDAGCPVCNRLGSSFAH